MGNNIICRFVCPYVYMMTSFSLPRYPLYFFGVMMIGREDIIVYPLYKVHSVYCTSYIVHHSPISFRILSIQQGVYIVLGTSIVA
jgi:hypothetical protein